MKNKTLETIEDFASAKSYITQAKYLFGQTITEYDISKANITTLLAFDRISKAEYDYLYNLPKESREYEIGMKIRSDKNYQDYIDEGIAFAKKRFLELNAVQPYHILRIANDSFYIVSPYLCSNLEIVGPNGTIIRFAQKKSYNVFMKLHGNLFFCNTLGEWYDIDVKGISDEQLPLHSEFLTFIAEISNDYLNGGRDVAVRNFNGFFQDFVQRKLPIDFYREFRAGGGFRINCGSCSYVLQTPPIDESDVNKLDINYNLNVLRTLYAYLMAG